MAPMGSNGGDGTKYAVVCIFLRYLYGNVICLKAPGNYSDQFWCNKISILLHEGPKPNISMISGCLSPGEPLFMDLNILKYFTNCKNKLKTVFGKYYFCKSMKQEF